MTTIQLANVNSTMFQDTGHACWNRGRLGWPGVVSTAMIDGRSYFSGFRSPESAKCLWKSHGAEVCAPDVDFREVGKAINQSADEDGVNRAIRRVRLNLRHELRIASQDGYSVHPTLQGGGIGDLIPSATFGQQDWVIQGVVGVEGCWFVSVAAGSVTAVTASRSRHWELLSRPTRCDPLCKGSNWGRGTKLQAEWCSWCSLICRPSRTTIASKHPLKSRHGLQMFAYQSYHQLIYCICLSQT